MGKSKKMIFFNLLSNIKIFEQVVASYMKYMYPCIMKLQWFDLV